MRCSAGIPRLALAMAAALEVGFAGPLSFQTVPFAINNQGQISGFSSDIAGTHGFIDTNGIFTVIDVPGSTDTLAYGINDAAQVIAFDNTHSKSYLFTGGHLLDIGVPGSTYTWAEGINDAGDIVGAFGDGRRAWGYVDHAGVITRLEVPGSIETDPYAINNQGQIVGRYVTINSAGVVADHGFLYSNGAFTTLDVPGAELTDATGINDAGQIVGSFGITENGVFHGHGFLFYQGIFTTIDYPGRPDTDVRGINNIGQIVGAIGNRTGFLDNAGVFAPIEEPATAFTPEPKSFLLLAGALAVLPRRKPRLFLPNASRNRPKITPATRTLSC